MAEAILRHQEDAFANDPYAAGTALYPDVGSALPEENTEGRLRQERMIEARRGMVVATQDRGEAEASQHEAALTPANFSPESQMTAPGRVEPNADPVH
jgi:hypothetical protein